MANKTLIVLRHAKSSWQTTESDQLRPLSERGERDAVAAGEILADYDLDVVLASNAARVQLTWEGAEDGGAECEDVQFLPALYQAWPDDLAALLRGLSEDDETVLLIGHQPSLAELILHLCPANELTTQVAKKYPTCGLAVLDVAGPWSDLGQGSATLTRFEIPRG